MAWTTLYRSLTRHRLFAALNIGGLALGIAVFLVLFLFVRFETRFDRVLPGWEKLWVVQRSLTIPIPGAPTVPVPSAPEMLAQPKGDYADTVGTRLLSDDVAVENGATSSTQRLAEVDRNYFTLFPFPAIAGNPSAALASPDSAVITRRLARDYYGGAALGRTLTYIAGSQSHTVRIAAVIEDMPADVTFAHDVFVPLPPGAAADRQTARGIATFLRFSDAAAAGLRAKQLDTFADRHPDPRMGGIKGPRMEHRLVPLAALHLEDARDRTIVTVLGIVGVLALLVAIGNYINLATVRAGLRAREVALRKVAGATRSALVVQFIAEAMVSVAIATLIGLALAEVALPLVNAAGGTALRIHYLGKDSILPPCLALIVLTALLAGIYPAFFLSRYRPAAVLSSTRAPGGGRSGARLRRAMVVGQFAIAVTLIAVTGVLAAQTRHLARSDLGFDRGGLVMIPSFNDAALDESQRRTLAVTVAGLPGVLATARSSTAPGGYQFWIGPMHRDGTTGADPMIVQADTGTGFFRTYRARLLAGRFFEPLRHPLDDSSGVEASKRPLSVILNRSATLRLGYPTPGASVGQDVRIGDGQTAHIIGAVLAVVIGCIRLYGLAAFDTARRVREIGIRKTLGATASEIMALLVGEFLRPVLFANLIAWPVAWIAMRAWLAGFDDRIMLSPLFFIGASLVALLIAGATVVGHAWRMARADPARALRHA